MLICIGRYILLKQEPKDKKFIKGRKIIYFYIKNIFIKWKYLFNTYVRIVGIVKATFYFYFSTFIFY